MNIRILAAILVAALLAIGYTYNAETTAIAKRIDTVVNDVLGRRHARQPTPHVPYVTSDSDAHATAEAK